MSECCDPFLGFRQSLVSDSSLFWIASVRRQLVLEVAMKCSLPECGEIFRDRFRCGLVPSVEMSDHRLSWFKVLGNK